MKFTLLATTVAVAALLAAPAIAQPKPAQAEVAVETAPGKASATRTVTVVATVTEVDASKGLVTLKAANGELYPLKVGPEVRNLPQVKVGDNVTVRYVENLTLNLLKGPKVKPTLGESSTAARADAGQKPAGLVAEQTEVIADVTAVNTKDKKITLKGPNRTVDLSVQDPEQLKLIKVGDQVLGVYTQALAVSVDAAPKKK